MVAFVCEKGDNYKTHFSYLQKKSYLCTVKKEKGYWRVIIYSLCGVIAYGYLAYKLITFDSYTFFLQQFSHNGGYTWCYLLGAFLLFPINILLESLRWQSLIAPMVPLKLIDAQRQVYQGVVGGFITPYRLGEIPTRLLTYPRSFWTIGLTLGIIGSVWMTWINIILGIPAAIAYLSKENETLLYLSIAIGGLVGLLLIGTPFILNTLSHRKWHNVHLQSYFTSFKNYSIKQMAVVGGWTMCRYLCYCTQLYWILIFCGVELDITNYLIGISLYYLLVTISPSAPIIDVGIRGSWAIWLFNSMVPQSTPNIMCAVLLMWIINTALPVIIGTLIKKNE